MRIATEYDAVRADRPVRDARRPGVRRRLRGLCGDAAADVQTHCKKAKNHNRRRYMTYYFNKTITSPYEAAIEKVKAALKSEGFGVLSEIDVKETLRQKLGIEFRPYCILGACNPPLAHKALLAEDKIGTMLPCNVIVQDLGGGQVEVAAINPKVAMQRVDNKALSSIADDVANRLHKVVNSL